MSIGGGVKFMKRSKSLLVDGNTIEATSGDSSSDRALDRNPYSYWRSVDSNDLTSEVLTIGFNDTVTLNRIFLIDHNWKEFNVKYFNGASYVAFASVVGIDGSLSGITETAFADDSSYYEFTPVSTDAIQITVTKTQTANQEKYINQIIATEELGTLVGYPDINNLKLSRNSRDSKVLSGKIISIKSEPSLSVDLKFQNYPASLSADIDLMFSLWDSEESFLIWLCGGRRGTTYFRKQLRGFRLRDAVNVQMDAVLNPDYSKNIYTSMVNFTAKFTESVD